MENAVKKVRIVSGSLALDIPKGLVCRVESMKELGPAYSHSVQLILNVRGKNRALYARHPNRVAEKVFHLNNGNPLKRITVERL